MIVMGVLGSIVMVTIDTTTSNQAMQETIVKMDRLAAAIARYKLNNPTLAPDSKPAVLGDLITNVTGIAVCADHNASSTLRGWCGPYLDISVSNDATDYTTDGWGTTFSWTRASGTLRSFGPNKVDNAGGSDDIQRTGL